MSERFVLLNNLPKEGDLVTFKILRKLRETLSPDEKEIKEYEFKDLYRCPNKEFDEKGKAFQCEVEEDSSTQPKCPIHGVLMVPIGRTSWNPEKWAKTKEIWFGLKANQIIVDALKKVSEEDKKVNDDIIASLCEKFLGNEDDEE
jgi:hypothetical protein